MSMSDPIADMLTRIRNAVTAKQTRVDMPASRSLLERAAELMPREKLLPRAGELAGQLYASREWLGDSSWRRRRARRD